MASRTGRPTGSRWSTARPWSQFLSYEGVLRGHQRTGHRDHQHGHRRRRERHEPAAARAVAPADRERVDLPVVHVGRRRRRTRSAPRTPARPSRAVATPPPSSPPARLPPARPESRPTRPSRSPSASPSRSTPVRSSCPAAAPDLASASGGPATTFQLTYTPPLPERRRLHASRSWRQGSTTRTPPTRRMDWPRTSSIGFTVVVGRPVRRGRSRPIPAIQGSGTGRRDHRPGHDRRAWSSATTRARRPTLRGFYLQDPAGDGDAATSDGLFVFNGSDDDASRSATSSGSPAPPPSSRTRPRSPAHDRRRLRHRRHGGPGRRRRCRSPRRRARALRGHAGPPARRRCT